MAVLATDIKFYHSGGAANTDPDASLGGARSTTEVAGTINALFDDVSSAEAAAGDAEYRCVYVRNEAAADTLIAAMFYIQSLTTSADTATAVGVGTSGIDGTEQVVANESTAPVGVTFVTGVGDPVARTLVAELGDLAPNEHIAVWIRRDVTAAAGSATDAVNWRVTGDTA